MFVSPSPLPPYPSPLSPNLFYLYSRSSAWLSRSVISSALHAVGLLWWSCSVTAFLERERTTRRYGNTVWEIYLNPI